MSCDVSVLIPACEAQSFIAAAVASVLAQTGVSAEIVIAADDDVDYGALLAGQDFDLARVVQCRTQAPRSGPAAARNLAASAASADLFACLDADDAFADGRLAPLMALADARGAATGPTVEIGPHGRTARTAAPDPAADRLAAADIARVRMPYFPVFRREFLGAGWPDIVFAEDMIFNLRLVEAVDVYAFARDARYLYHRRPGSLSDAPDTLERARTAYRQILSLLEGANWSGEIWHMAREVIREDLEAVEQALARRDGSRGSWREALTAVATAPGGPISND